MSSTHYAIIGGGIAGASIAYHLSEKTDEPITVYERQSPVSETTYKSMALFGLYGDETQYRMKRYGLKLYNEFYAAPKANPRYHLLGRLYLATTPENDEKLRRSIREGEDLFPKITTGMDRDLVDYIPGGELKERLLVPALDAEVVEGALHRPRVGVTNPQELGFEFLERARENGVTVRSNTRVMDVLTEDGRVTGIELGSGERVEADDVICAAGPWNIRMAETVGIDLPVRHTLAAVLKLQPEEPLGYPIPYVQRAESPYVIQTQPARDESGVFVSYNPGGYADAGSEYDPDTMGETVSEEIRVGAFEELELLMPSLADAPLVDEWVGIRSVTPDGNPIVGWTDVEGFSIAAFHTSGIQLSPAVGRIVTEQLVDGEPTSYYESLSISRFDGHTDVHGGA